MIFFYLPGCSHCDNAMPNYNEAGQQLKEEHLHRIASINARDNLETAKKYIITKYPTILYFQSGSYVEFKQERSVEGFRDYVVKMKSPGGANGDFG